VIAGELPLAIRIMVSDKSALISSYCTVIANEAPPQTDEIYATQKLDSIATSSRVQDI